MLQAEMQTKKKDLKHRTYQYALGVIRYLESLPKGYVAETLGKQLLRSATSVGANVAEAQAGSSRRDFANFYNHALKSANESKYWLGLLEDSGSNGSPDPTALINETEELANILASCILTLKGKKGFEHRFSSFFFVSCSFYFFLLPFNFLLIYGSSTQDLYF